MEKKALWDFPLVALALAKQQCRRAWEQHAAETKKPGLSGRKLQPCFSFNAMEPQRTKNIW